MSTKPIVAVIGSTGLQGSSVAKYLLADANFAVRAITRKADSPVAQELKASGAEIVTADLEDVESLKSAFSGVHGVFALTVWELFAQHNQDPEITQAHEERLGRNVVDAAEAEGIKHLVWSTLDHDSTQSIFVYHFESKYNVDEYLKTKNIPRTSLYTSTYYQTLLMYQVLVKEEDGFILKYPMPSNARTPLYDVTETGAWVLEAFKNPELWINKDMHAVAEWLSARDFSRVLNEATGNKVKLAEISEDTFNSQQFKDLVGNEFWIAAQLVNLGLWKRDEVLSRKAFPGAATFADYVARNSQFKAFIGA